MAEVGRPTVMTEEVIAKLEIAFSNGATDEQACFIANISKNSLYDYIKINPEFGNRKEALKDFIKYQAKINIKEAIESNDKDMSKWYLERKDKEFKPKSDMTSNDEKIIPIINVSANNSDQQDNSVEEEA
jgi:hypothetical protein